MKKNSKISLLFFTSIVLLMCGCNKNNNDSKEEKTYNNSSQEFVTEGMQNDDKSDIDNKTSDSLDSEDNATVGNISVSYLESEEIVQKEYYESAGDIGLNRPSTLNGSEVFIGWAEQDVISQIGNNTVNENDNLSLTVETIDISEIENAIYNDTVYVSDESEYIEIPVIIGGNTNFSILDLEISFDAELFTFDSFTFTDEDALCNYNEGKIFVSFVSTSNIKSDVNLCNLKLKKNASKTVDSKLNYEVKDIAAWDNASTGYIEVSHNIINDKIVMY